MIDFSELMETAIERVTPYLPDMHEVDDDGSAEGIFQFCVFDMERCPGRLVDRFRFARRAGETDAETMERFNETVEKYIESWR